METTPRKIYTGASGFISPNRKAKFNVAIRTALVDREAHKAEYGVGGGIVWDSTSSDEYSEAMLKARVLTESQPQFSLLETMLWTPEDEFFLQEKHIARLLDSAAYFDFPISSEILESYMHEISSSFNSPRRVRVLLDRQGTLHSESTPFHRTENVLQVRLAKEPVNSTNVYLFHKTTQRDVYENARADFPTCDDILLRNERGELTEFTIGNLVVEMDGKLITPPIECGVLAGTFRAHLLETGQVVERPILLRELGQCTKIFRVNSLRKWEQAKLQPEI